MKSVCRWAACAVLLLCPASLMGQDAAKDAAAKDPAAKPPAETVAAKSDVIRLYETVKARVEAPATAELKTNMDVFLSLIVDQVTAPSTAVKKGDVVLKFKTDKIEQQLQEAKYELDIAGLTLKEAESNLNQVVQTFDLDNKIAQESWDHKQQDVDYYFRITAPFSERRVKKNLESATFQVEYAQDELDQLEKMYKEDELTEESEEIVLKRARRSLDTTKFYFESEKDDHDHSLSVELPRNADSQRKSLQRGELEFKKAMISLPSQRQLKELELQKQQFTHAKQKREYEKLLADMEKMSLKSPMDGVVYHGQCRRGTWSNAAGSPSRVIESGVTLQKDAVVITIVDSAKLRLRGELEEKQLASIHPGSIGTARPTANSDASFATTVAEIGSIPVEEGKFDCKLNGETLPKLLIPGMTCEVKLLAYEKKDTVTVPKASVFSDDDGQSHYVFVPTDAGSERREIKAGKTKDDRIEVVTGLKSGDKILKAKPE